MVNLKKTITLMLLLTSVMLFVSCSKGEQEQNNYNDPNAFNDSNSFDDSNNGNNGSQNRPGGFFGSNPDLYGEVKSISGNEVTIALLEMPQRRQMSDEERQQARDGMGSQDNQNRPRVTRDPNATRAPRVTRDPNATPNPNATRRPRAGQGQPGGFSTERKYTGKSEAIKIPGDIPITTFSRGNGSFEEKQLKLSDVKEGAILQVFYKKDAGDKKEIESIRVVQIPSN